MDTADCPRSRLPIRVSEKSLELNVGAELLNMLRWRLGMPKAYLRGLTQAEESREGVDFFAELSPATRIFAFQFKAPKAQWGDVLPYRFTVQQHQHVALASLASNWPKAVHYVLPFFVRPAKLRHEVPHLLSDTWFLRVAAMLGTNVFGPHKSRTMRCTPGIASINPDFELQRAQDFRLGPDGGIPVGQFAEWYAGLDDYSDLSRARRQARNRWLVRGLRVAIVQPEDVATSRDSRTFSALA